MQIRSKKAKGHSLEKLVRQRLIEAFNLNPEDIRIPVGSETGVDIKLNSRAKKKVPFQIECKNQEIFGTIYKYYEQASNHTDNLIPLLIIKMNRQEPLAILNLDFLLTLLAMKEKEND